MASLHASILIYANFGGTNRAIRRNNVFSETFTGTARPAPLMHVSDALRESALAALLDLWAREGFQVPTRQNATFLMLWKLAGLSDEIRQRIGIEPVAAPYYPRRGQ